MRVTNQTRSTDSPSASYPASPFRLFEDFFNDWAVRSALGGRSETWKPAVDVLEKDGNLILQAAGPGLNENEIELKLEGNVLTFEG